MPQRTPARLQARRVMRDRLGVPRAARFSLQWDVLAGLLAGAYMGMTFPFLTRIAKGELHAGTLLLAAMSAAPFIGNLLAPFWATRMEGRSKMPFVMASWLPARSFLLVMPFVHAAAPFVALVAGLQLLGAFSSPAYTSLMKDIYPDSSRGRLMGYVRVCAQAAAFVSAQSAGRLMDHGVSFRVLFPLAGVLGIGAALAFRQVRPLTEPAPEAPLPAPAGQGILHAWAESLLILRDNVPYRWFAASVMTYGFGNLMSVPLYALFQVDHLHVTNTQIALLANISALCSIPSSFFWGRFIDRHGPSRTVMLSIVCVCGIGAMYTFAQTITPLYFAAAFSGIGFAGIELSYLQSILQYSAADGRPARYQALHSLLLGIRGVLAPTLGLQLLPHFGYRPLFIATLVLMILGAYLQSRARDSVPAAGVPT